MNQTCIICKQPIGPKEINQEVTEGYVHVGSCSDHYTEMKTTITEDSSFNQVMKNTELLM